MPIIKGNARDRLVIPNFASRKHSREYDFFRTPKIKTKNGRFTVSASPAKSYSIGTHYPKIIVNQAKALAYAERERKQKKEPRPSMKKRPVAKIIVRTHNKEHTRRTEQAELLKSQTAKTRSEIRSKLFKMFREGKALWKPERKDEIVMLFKRLISEAQGALETEKFFQSKNPKTSARKTSDNRINFVAENINQTIEAVAFLECKKYVEPGFTQNIKKLIYEKMPEHMASKLEDTSRIGNGRWQNYLRDLRFGEV